ncbi:SidA/IucD/PvdA family monooxygenase, partial [Mycobacteroides abscessus]|uniref:SidA/IucD/PvdA family monooxygenase n=1 Tax=Mycobacteroides abscessus TaxID=36809 RepID=UPI0019294191
DKHGIGEHVRWETEVISADWDDSSGTWTVALRSKDGRVSRVAARAIISAVGQLNRPQIPDIEDADTFAGKSFHSAAWDHGARISGRRVALIGAGASGFQIAPAIADEVEHLD